MSKAFLLFVHDESIGEKALADVESKLKTASADELFLMIKTYGGSPFDAVAIMNILHKKFTKISVIVPEYAKSAGTLMSLGADEIYMTDRSALGPLDLPIEHPGDGSRISALDVQNTITNTATLVESIAKSRFKYLRNNGMSKKDAATMALANANDFLKPVVSQVDPYHLQKAQRELRIGYWYALDMLRARMMKTGLQAPETAKTLVHDFPAHEYCIYAGDAKYMLGLNVKDLSGLKEWNDELKAKYDAVRRKDYHIEYGTIAVNATPKPATKTSKKKAARP